MRWSAPTSRAPTCGRRCRTPSTTRCSDACRAPSGTPAAAAATTSTATAETARSSPARRSSCGGGCASRPATTRSCRRVAQRPCRPERGHAYCENSPACSLSQAGPFLQKRLSCVYSISCGRLQEGLIMQEHELERLAQRRLPELLRELLAEQQPAATAPVREARDAGVALRYDDEDGR